MRNPAFLRDLISARFPLHFENEMGQPAHFILVSYTDNSYFSNLFCEFALHPDFNINLKSQKTSQTLFDAILATLAPSFFQLKMIIDSGHNFKRSDLHSVTKTLMSKDNLSIH